MLKQMIYDLLKTNKTPLNIHEIATLLNLDELTVLHALNQMSRKVIIVPRPLSSICNDSVYYTVR